MDNKDAYTRHLENTIVNLNETISGLQNQISNLTEMIMLLRKEKFGSSSEKTSYQVEGQISRHIFGYLAFLYLVRAGTWPRENIF